MRTFAAPRLRIFLTVAMAWCVWYETSSVLSVRAATRPALSQNVAGGTQPGPLDFNTYRNRIEPIFLKKRQGDVRCYDCHSVMNTRLRLQTLSPGAASFSEEQSRLNFQTVSALVTPSEPMKSRLLCTRSRQRPVETLLTREASFGRHKATRNGKWLPTGSKGQRRNCKPTAYESHDADGRTFQPYKENVEPIFLKERAGHARCYDCHSAQNRIFRQSNCRVAVQIGPRSNPSATSRIFSNRSFQEIQLLAGS